jgi:hypothetical protein
MSGPLVPLRCLSAVCVLDGSQGQWALLQEPSDPSTPRAAKLRVEFDAPFSGPPVVHIGVVGLDVSKSDNTRLRARAEDVSASGFVVSVETWLNTQIWSVEISWLAIGS